MFSISPLMRYALILLLVLLSACAPGAEGPAGAGAETAKPASPATAQVTITPEAGQALPTQSQPTAQNTLQSPSSTAALFHGPLSVIITSTMDEAVVMVPRLELTGEADPDTVISIDDQFVVAGQDRTFAVTVTLEEGPNVIEITASDPTGSQGTVYLTITYEPQP